MSSGFISSPVNYLQKDSSPQVAEWHRRLARSCRQALAARSTVVYYGYSSGHDIRDALAVRQLGGNMSKTSGRVRLSDAKRNIYSGAQKFSIGD